MVSCSPPRPQSTELPWIQTDSSWQLNLFFFLQSWYLNVNLKLFTVMTVHDRVKESFESTVLQNLCVGFLQGFITSQACPGHACVCVCVWGGEDLTFILICVCVAQRVKKRNFRQVRGLIFCLLWGSWNWNLTNVRHKNWTFLQFWGFEMQIFQKFVILGECRLLRN